METSVNNKCRAFTSLEQSKKLAEILPLDSADMCWFEGEPFVEAVTGYQEERAESHRQAGMEICPCWSLAALLGVLPDYNLQRTDWENNKTEYKIVVTMNDYNYASKNYDNPLDAAYELILKLNKLNLL